MSVAFWRDLAERAGVTAIETLVALMLADGAFNVLTFNWATALTVTLSTTVLSVAKSLAAGQVGDPDTASLVATRGPGRLP